MSVNENKVHFKYFDLRIFLAFYIYIILWTSTNTTNTSIAQNGTQQYAQYVSMKLRQNKAQHFEGATY